MRCIISVVVTKFVLTLQSKWAFIIFASWRLRVRGPTAAKRATGTESAAVSATAGTAGVAKAVAAVAMGPSSAAGMQAAAKAVTVGAVAAAGPATAEGTVTVECH